MRDWRDTFIRDTRGWMQKLSQQLEECGDCANLLTLSVNERTIAAVERRLKKLQEVLTEAKCEDVRHKKLKRDVARYKRKG